MHSEYSTHLSYFDANVKTTIQGIKLQLDTNFKTKSQDVKLQSEPKFNKKIEDVKLQLQLLNQKIALLDNDILQRTPELRNLFDFEAVSKESLRIHDLSLFVSFPPLVEKNIGRGRGGVLDSNRGRIRTFWKSLLQYWPPANGHLTVLCSPGAVIDTLKVCLQKSKVPIDFILDESVNVFEEVLLMKGEQVLRQKKTFLMNFWKFDLHKRSNSSIVGVIDDDACLLKTLLPRDILNPQGKIIVRAMKGADQWHQVNYKVGLGYVGNFMTDFPVFWWSEMMNDMESWAEEKFPFLKERAKANGHNIMWNFIKHLYTLGVPSKFNVIFNWAYDSPKWHDKYEWRISPDNFTMPGSLHVHNYGGCPDINDNFHFGIDQLLYPFNLQYYYQKGAAVPYFWRNKTFHEPELD